MFTRPLVHVGFLKSWLAGGLNDKVVGRIVQLVHARPAGSHAKPLKIYVTGTPTPTSASCTGNFYSQQVPVIAAATHLLCVNSPDVVTSLQTWMK